MGPRSFNRGNGVPDSAVAVLRYASMGPRSFNRGNYWQALEFQIVWNELQWGRGHSTAETSNVSRNVGGLGTSFNGAAVIQPRKHVRKATGKGKGPIASMGPRSFNRGNYPTSRHAAGDRLRFNGAAVIQPRKHLAATEGCQVAVGRSMGPRSFNRGNTVPRNRQTPSLRWRSMGPRSFNRGNTLV